jgi:hypothetical protein
MELKTVSMCVNSSYCKGYNDAVEEANEKLDKTAGLIYQAVGWMMAEMVKDEESGLPSDSAEMLDRMITQLDLPRYKGPEAEVANG